MVTKRRPPQTRDTEYVVERYGFDIRDRAHAEARVNYFETIFFQETAFTREHGIEVDKELYANSKLVLTNEYWRPPDGRLIDNGVRLIVEKIKAKKLKPKKYNEAKIPDGHHFSADGKRIPKGFENNTSVRVDALEVGTSMVIHGRKVTYFDQIATNIAAKEGRMLGGRQVRRLDSTPNGSPKSFRESMLANSLGVACMFVLDDKDKTIIPRYRVPERKKGQSTIGMNGTWHCSSSGVFEVLDLIPQFKVSDPGKPETKQFELRDIEAGMRREIEMESGFINEEDYRLEPICFTREIPRAGKPQLFYRALLNGDKFKTVEQVKIALLDEENRKEEGWEYDDQKLETQEFDNLVSALRRDWHDEYFNVMSYEGIANYKFCRF